MKQFWLKIKFMWEYSTSLQTDNNPPLELIFKFMNGLDRKNLKKIYKKYRKTETGKKVFSRNYSVLDKVQTGNFKSGTFGAEFQTWLRDSDGAVDIFKINYPGKDDTKLGKFFKESTMQHDLIHFLNGYDTTPLAEVGVLSFNLAKEWRESFSSIIYSSFIMSIRNTFMPSKYPSGISWYEVFKYSPIVVFIGVVIEGRRRGKRAPWLMEVDWDSYLNVDLQEVKKELKLQEGLKYWNDIQPVWKKTLSHYKDYAKNHGTTIYRK